MRRSRCIWRMKVWLTAKRKTTQKNRKLLQNIPSDVLPKLVLKFFVNHIIDPIRPKHLPLHSEKKPDMSSLKMNLFCSLLNTVHPQVVFLKIFFFLLWYCPSHISISFYMINFIFSLLLPEYLSQNVLLLFFDIPMNISREDIEEHKFFCDQILLLKIWNIDPIVF